MAELIMTRGLPASGKSTWACQNVRDARPGTVVRINKDLLRTMLHDGVHRGKSERQVLAARDTLIGAFLGKGVSVIVDDTNLNPIHETRLRELANSHGAQFRVQDFTEITFDECVTRDLARVASVGEAVIREMYDTWLKPAPVELPQLPIDAPVAVLVDIDGTVALMNGRRPFDWEKVGEDLPNPTIIKMVQLFAHTGHQIIFMSGRDAVCREKTQKWLEDHVSVDFELYMRPRGDNRKDSIVKRELFDAHVASRYRVLAVLDDRDQVVRMWRDDLGLTCLQVAPGSF